MPDIYGLCAVCGKVAEKVCSLCGKSVCLEHFDPVSRTCITCRMGRK